MTKLMFSGATGSDDATRATFPLLRTCILPRGRVRGGGGTSHHPHGMTGVRFVLLLSAPAPDDVSAPEVGRRTDRLVHWVDELRHSGVLVDGGAVEAGAVAVRSRAGGLSTIDVPAEAIALVRSSLMIDVPGSEAAVAVARSCPEAAYAEVPVLVVDDLAVDDS